MFTFICDSTVSVDSETDRWCSETKEGTNHDQCNERLYTTEMYFIHKPKPDIFLTFCRSLCKMKLIKTCNSLILDRAKHCIHERVFDCNALFEPET